MRVALLIIATIGATIGLPIGVVALRAAKRRNGAGRSQAKIGITGSGITLGLVILGVLLIQAFNRSYDRVYRIKCQHNVRAIGQALLLYANDNKGQFPRRFSQLITDADVNPEIFLCPASADQTATGPTRGSAR